jgi:uncharacterized protein YbbK (DUF523 family)
MRAAPEELRIAVSSCLLGERVRYDGGHKRDPALVELARFALLVPVCPEVELGLGTPREPIRLERRGREVRLVSVESRRDHTAAMGRFAEARVRELERFGVSGFVLKKDSPSCGLDRVWVWDGAGSGRSRAGRGLFAAALVERLPRLPVEEEDRLHDPALLASFVERAVAYLRGRLGP